MSKKISKSDTKLLCRVAWEDAINNKKMAIDDWIGTTFNTRFNELKSHTSTYITKKGAKRLCRIAWWHARVNLDVYKKIEAWFNGDFLTIIKKEIRKKKPITYVYLVVCENDVSGAWTDPEEAVKNEFSYDLKKIGGKRLSHIDRVITVKEAVKEMLKPNSRYPYLKKVEINPAKKVY